MTLKFLYPLLLSISTSTLTFSQSCQFDTNNNGVVDGLDLLELLTVYGETCDENPPGSPVISEIHYNPSQIQGQDSEWEFIELFNPHESAIDISGWELVDGIEVSIPLDTWIEPQCFVVFVSSIESYNGELPYSTTIIEWP
jgi:hypothetical protein